MDHIPLPAQKLEVTLGTVLSLSLLGPLPYWQHRKNYYLLLL